MLVLLQGGGVTIGPNGCWDCPISFRDALEIVAIVLASTALGIMLRCNNKRYVRIIGNCFLIFGILGIFAINHAGWNWGIIRSADPVEFYSREAVSVFSLVTVAVGAGLDIYFRRRPQKKSDVD